MDYYLKRVCVSETIKNKAKEQKTGVLSILLGTLGARLLGNILTGKGVARTGEETARVGYGSKRKFLVPKHPLTNLEIQMYYQNELRFTGVHSRDTLPDKTKEGAYLINLDEYSDIGTHCIALYVNTKTVTCFDSFGLEHIPKEIKNFISNKNVIANIFRIQAYDSEMCECFCIGLIKFMFKGNSLTDFTNLFSPNKLKKMVI